MKVLADPPTPTARLPRWSTVVRTLDRRELVLAAMPVAALVALLVALGAANPQLLTSQSLLTLADSAAPLVVLAAGVTVVILMGSIDLSIAAVASLSTVLLALWVPHLTGGAVVATVLTAAAIGCLHGVVHVVFRVPSLVVTLGGMMLWSAVALLASGASTLPLTDTGATDWAFTRIGGTFPSAVLIALGLVVGIAITLRLTPLGRWVVAIGHAERAARMSGVPVGVVRVLAFTISGACAGLAGVLLVARTFSGAPSLADSLLLPAIAAVVVAGTAISGGHGGLWRTLVGAGIVTLLRVGLSIVGIPSAYESILYGVLIIGSVALTINRSKISVVK